jgi:3-dehydroquinate synthase
MKKIDVNIKGSPYPILIERGARRQTGQLLAEHLAGMADVALVTNPTVGHHYQDDVVESIRQAGISCCVIEVPDGERYKTLTTISDIYDGLLEAGLDRKGLIVALGGGVVGDMTGFAAATYLRGVPFVQIPTTLLSMVDASVGGKTGVDLPQGKNLVGAFNQPEMVIVDPDVLGTLPGEELASGMAEVIKHGIIGNPSLFKALEDGVSFDFENLIADAVQVKVDVVSRDPFEQGERALLNLGHTFGHAFELLSNYRIKHGIAVGVGLVAAAHLAAALGEGMPGLTDRIKRVLMQHRLTDSFSGYAVAEVIDAMRHDKKRAKKQHRFVIPLGLGRCEIRENPPVEAIERAVAAVIVNGGQ